MTPFTSSDDRRKVWSIFAALGLIALACFGCAANFGIPVSGSSDTAEWRALSKCVGAQAQGQRGCPSK